ncbi:MAG: YihY/virulence factor BrkB family protein [Bacteroidales bacterium]|nr:YihY/virulence factor BrkB family protein [Bacteroidales bacterium]
MAKISVRLNNYFQIKRNLLLNSKQVTSAEDFLRKLVIPGFDGMPVYDVAAFFIKGLQKGAISMRAAAFSYNFFLALFPTIIFFFTIIPYIPITGFQDNLLELLQNFIPKKAFEAVEGTLFDIVKRPRGGLLSIGFVMALYFSTNGIHSLIVAFNQSRHTVETRSWVKQRIISIVLVVILSLLIIIAIVLITLGPAALDFLVRHNMLRGSFTYYLLIAGKWLISSAMLFFAFSFLYFLAPAAESRFSFFSAGSTLSTVLTILASIGFNYYVNSISQYNSLYGSIGTLIIIMVWIYFNAMIVLIGFELNVSIRNAKRKFGRLPRFKHDKKPVIRR